VSRTYRILAAVVVSVLAVGGYYKLVLAPKRAQVTELDQQVATAQAQLAQTQNLIVTYQGAQKAYKDNYATVVRLGKAVPVDDDTRSLVVQLDAAAKRSGVEFDTININGSGGNTATGTAPVAPGAISAGAYSAMPFAFSFSGDFGTLGNFFSRLESFVALKGDKIEVNGRLLRVETIALQPGPDGWPQLNATVGASSYIVPQGTSTPTPSTPTTPSSTGTTTAASGTATSAG
jgi:Tfp pilus assembly protein PilO